MSKVKKAAKKGKGRKKKTSSNPTTRLPRSKNSPSRSSNRAITGFIFREQSSSLLDLEGDEIEPMDDA
ncbi:hypothetical protein N7495_004667 [Penicillium taxi]|uniref:uncharacterized protein n=1 Tax=Penicillium taxi TaxID=168475 RepID=UPI002544FA0E|nr:uncharacterized protein N7495_004667 [Penicillium taxi]KAJ5899923.1 hypothetical protein N7495_004667 [Penicillium taxi]